MAIGNINVLYRRILRFLPISFLDQMFSFSLPKAEEANINCLFTSDSDPGITLPSNINSVTLPTGLPSIIISRWSFDIILHFPTLIFIPYFKHDVSSSAMLSASFSKIVDKSVESSA